MSKAGGGGGAVSRRVECQERNGREGERLLVSLRIDDKSLDVVHRVCSPLTTPNWLHVLRKE